MAKFFFLNLNTLITTFALMLSKATTMTIKTKKENYMVKLLIFVKVVIMINEVLTKSMMKYKLF